MTAVLWHGYAGWAPIKDGIGGWYRRDKYPFTEQLLQEIHDAVGAELAVFVPSDEGYVPLTATLGVQTVSNCTI